jgi:hypothetical protein
MAEIEAALTRLDAAARSRSDAATLELRLLEEQERHQALRSGCAIRCRDRCVDRFACPRHR